MNEAFVILNRISPKSVRKGPIDNNSVLVEVMARRRAGGKPLPEQSCIYAALGETS